LLLFYFSFVYAQNLTNCEVPVDASGIPKPFAFCHSENGFTMFWTLPDGSSIAEIAYQFWTDNGWIGAGFSPDGNMANSQVLIGWFHSNGGEVHEYQVGDHELGSLANKIGIVGTPTILTNNGRAVITYNRTVNNSIGAIPIYPKALNYMVYGWSSSTPTGTSDVSQHDEEHAFKVSLTTGAVAAVSEGWMTRDTGKKVHGVLMGLTFILIFPLGVVIARYLKPVRPPLWFELHRALQWAGVVLSTFAFVVAINVLSTDTYKTHRVIGIIAMALVFWQPLNTFIRPHPPKQGEPISNERRIWNLVHHWSGRVCVVLGIINVYIGLVDVVKADHAYTIVVSIFLFVLFLVGATLSFHKWEVKTEEKTRVPEAAPFLGGNEGGNGADSDDDK